jgi:hypothetical protein
LACEKKACFFFALFPEEKNAVLRHLAMRVQPSPLKLCEGSSATNGSLQYIGIVRVLASASRTPTCLRLGLHGNWRKLCYQQVGAIPRFPCVSSGHMVRSISAMCNRIWVPVYRLPVNARRASSGNLCRCENGSQTSTSHIFQLWRSPRLVLGRITLLSSRELQ